MDNLEKTRPQDKGVVRHFLVKKATKTVDQEYIEIVDVVKKGKKVGEKEVVRTRKVEVFVDDIDAARKVAEEAMKQLGYDRMKVHSDSGQNYQFIFECSPEFVASQ